MRRLHRRLLFRLLLPLLGLAALVVLVASLAPAGPEPMPETIWIRGEASVMDRKPAAADLRADSPDGPALVGVRWRSSWNGGWSPSDGEGISFRRNLTEGQRRKLRLARIGLVPRFRVYGAGYEATGRRVERDGEVWREFRLFNRRFNYTQIGWWRW